jgi:hypothetical protein
MRTIRIYVTEEFRAELVKRKAFAKFVRNVQSYLQGLGKHSFPVCDVPVKYEDVPFEDLTAVIYSSPECAFSWHRSEGGEDFWSDMTEDIMGDSMDMGCQFVTVDDLMPTNIAYITDYVIDIPGVEEHEYAADQVLLSDDWLATSPDNWALVSKPSYDEELLLLL